jgi:hypothetical protein
VTALLFSVLLFVGEIVNNLPIVQPRYVIAPALLVYTGIVAMLRPRAPTPRPRSAAGAWTPVVVFALVLAVTCGFNYRVTNGRSASPAWTSVVAAATQKCMKPGMADYYYHHHGWWQFKIPCGRVRSSS